MISHMQLDPSTATFDPGVGRYVAPFDCRRLARFRFDVVVVGSGSAGATAALTAAELGASVAVISKDSLGETNTRYAQGGVAVVLDPSDSCESHVADTLRVGCGLSEPATVERVVQAGPEAFEWTVGLGAKYDLAGDGSLDLSREGGHSHPRIVHAGGASTGIELQRVLSLGLTEHPNIELFENCQILDLLHDEESGRASALLARTERGELSLFRGSQFVLATGGAGQLFRETTNPVIATGDGVALGFRAGAAVRDMEFFQFHPTCLYIAGAARVLISEVVRGAGGILCDKDGVRFMPDYHERAELAPRDVVSRACFDRMVKTADTSVYLDLSAVERDPHQLFPGISRICSLFGIDIARDPIPVRPGAHYMVGGLQVDTSGRTSTPGLWAVGECASTGLHGANRMGSNSLLEGLVLGRSVGASAAATSRLEGFAAFQNPSWSRAEHTAPVSLGIEDMTYSLKSLMWRQMGIVRTEELMQDALEKVLFWNRAVRELAAPGPKSWELSNMLLLAQLSTRAALARTESRGVHYREDWPESLDALRAHSVITAELGANSARLQHTPVELPDSVTVPDPTTTRNSINAPGAS